MQPEVVGISDFMIKGKEIQGQFTCVHPDIQRWGIAQKMHRAIHGFARKHRLNYFVGQMSPGMTKMYEKFQRNPRVHHQTRLPTEHITITRSRKEGILPSAKVRFTPFLRRGAGKPIPRAKRLR
jgi:GNAT superfamily N-acetyltransferase